MKQGLIIFIILLIFYVPCNGQKDNPNLFKNELKLAVVLEKPVGLFNENFKNGSSGNITFYWHKVKNNSFLVNSGFGLWQPKDVLSKKGFLIPFFVGDNFKLDENIYLEGGTGINIFTKGLGSGAHFGLNAGVGYLIKMSDGFLIDISTKLNYTSFQNSGYYWVSFSIGYKLVLKEHLFTN